MIRPKTIYYGAAAIVLVTLVGLGVTHYKDQQSKKAQAALATQLQLKTAEAQKAAANVAAAETKAAAYKTQKEAAEAKLAVAEAKLKPFKDAHPTAKIVTEYKDEPCKELAEAYKTQDEALEDCHEALTSATDENKALETANVNLHKVTEETEQKAQVLTTSLETVTKDRDVQESRKKSWRTVTLTICATALAIIIF